MGAKWQRVLIKIPKDIKPRDRVKIADAVLEHIRDRTERGVGVIKRQGSLDGIVLRTKQFAKYSKAYKESLDFEIAGKTDTVDLTLSGDMLIEMDLLSHKAGEIRIGYDKDSEENERADGNIRGTSGPAGSKPRAKRDFLGIEARVLSRIIAQHRKDKDKK